MLLKVYSLRMIKDRPVILHNKTKIIELPEGKFDVQQNGNVLLAKHHLLSPVLNKRGNNNVRREGHLSKV